MSSFSFLSLCFSFRERKEKISSYRPLSRNTQIKEKSLHSGKDNEFNAFILDEDSEDRLLDEMEDLLAEGGCVVDFHTCGLFPERWFDLVLVLRADTNVLYDRLKKRGYNDRKVNENMECEIMQVVLEEARESYAEDIVKEIKSNSIEELEKNVESVATWAKQWTLAKSSS